MSSELPAHVLLLAHQAEKTMHHPQRNATRPTPLAAGLLALLGMLPSSAHGQTEVQGWGYDQDGQVSSRPTGLSIQQVVAGSAHSLALLTDGSLVSWGDDSLGQISGTPTGNNFTQVTAGLGHSMALRMNGSIAAWGYDFNGQVSGTPGGTGFIQVAGGRAHSVALRADGSIVVWGNDTWNQVSDTPTALGFTHVAAGREHSLALRADGSIVSWGSNQSGVVSNTPSMSGFVQLTAGGGVSHALRADGSIVAWGEDSDNQVSGAPAGTGFTQVETNDYASMALRTDGSIATWGSDIWGQVSQAPQGAGFVQVAIGWGHCLALGPGNSGVSFCSGHSIGCLCGSSSGEGCLNSTVFFGARLEASGDAYVSIDTFRFDVSHLPGRVFGLVLRGANQLSGGQGILVGDGVLCVSGQTARSQVQASTNGLVSFTDFQGSPFGASSYGVGVPTYYQYWYRDVLNGCTGQGFNFSNAWTVTWLP